MSAQPIYVEFAAPGCSTWTPSKQISPILPEHGEVRLTASHRVTLDRKHYAYVETRYYTYFELRMMLA
jgi:hypothetical protein